MIQFTGATTLILSGMDIRQAETFTATANSIIKFTGVPYFSSARRSVATTTGSLGGGNDDADLYIKIVGDVNTRYLRQESGGSALQQDSYKTAGMFKDETSRSKFTFLFEPPNNQILVLDDGIYPNMDFDCGGSDTATLAFDFCYTAGNNNRTNDFKKVDMLTLTIDSSFDVKPTDYNIINKQKHIIIRNGYDLNCSTFDMGYATLEIIPCISVTGANVASLYVPTNDTATFGPTPSGSQAMGMKTKYSTLIIGTPIDENSALFMQDNTILVCDDLIIKAGGRLYGSERDDENSTEIHSIKQPTIEGDWNFVQTSEGIYRAQGSTPTLPVSMGGTGLTSIGTQGQVLAVKSNGQGLEWRANELDELSDVSITSAAEQEILRYDATAGEWINDTHDTQFIRVKAAEALNKGDVVFIFAVHNANVVKVKKARADSTSTMPAIGIMYETLALDAEGLAIVFGKANGIAANYTVGETMYVSPTTAGGVTNTKPTSGSHLIQNVGILMQAHASNAVIKVTGVGRSNDIPNATITTNSADADYVYIDDGNVWKKITPANLGIGGGSDTNTFVIVGEESDNYISSTAAAGNANGYVFSFGNGAQNSDKNSTGSDIGVILPVACTLSRVDITFGNIGNRQDSTNQTLTVYKNGSSTTTTLVYNSSGSSNNPFKRNFASLSGNGLSYAAGDTFNLRATGLAGYTETQVGPARMTAYFTVS